MKKTTVKSNGRGRPPVPPAKRKETQAVTLEPGERKAVQDEIEIRVRQGEVRMTESQFSRHLIRIGLELHSLARDNQTAKGVLAMINFALADRETLSTQEKR